MLFFHMVFCQSVVCLILQAYQLFVVCMLIELDDGKIYKKALYLMVKTMVSCRFSLKPIQWYAVQQSNRTWLSSGERRLRFRAMDIRWYSLYGSHGPWAMELQSEFPNHIKKSWLFSFWWLIDDYWFWKHLHKKNWLWLLILVMFSWFSSISTRIHTRNQDVRRSTISTLSRPGARSGLRQFAGRSLGGMGIALWSLNVAMENHHSYMVPSGKLT